MTLLWLRRLMAMVFLVAIIAGFISYDTAFSMAGGWLFNSQFIPTILRIAETFSLGAVLVLALLVIGTLLFGRVYCSLLCPLGVLQDIVSRLLRLGRPGRRNSPQAVSLWRGVIAACFGLTLAAGWLHLVGVLAPYALFGKILVFGMFPLPAFGWNGVVSLLENQGVYGLAAWSYPWHRPAGVAGILLLLALAAGLAWKERVFCRYLCPVGFFLEKISRHSVLSVSIDTHACTACGLCEKVCKMGAISSKRKHVDAGRCVACFRCLTVCPHHGLTYGREQGSQERTVHAGRRKLLGYVAGLASLTGLMRLRRTMEGTAAMEAPVIPPGSGSFSNLARQCVGCQRCVHVCPTGVIRPGGMRHGLAGFMLPVLDYDRQFCLYECNRCSQVCPSGAILPVELARKQRIQLGIAQLDPTRCIVYAQATACGACAEHCPTQAVHMVPIPGGLLAPEVTDGICVGCGACEHACPARPIKAIHVTAHARHGIAQPPEAEQEPPVAESEQTEDFPF